MAGNIYGPNGAFGNLQPGATGAAPAAQPATTYNPNWKPGGMYNMGNPGTAAPAAAPATVAPKPLGEVGTTMPTVNSAFTPQTFGGTQPNTYGPNGAFGGGQSTAPKLDYLSPQDMVSDAMAQRAAPRFRPLGGLFGVGYRQ